ncbi:MAG: hypothetical protein PHE15_03060 [Dehalococcoidales bacterium]|nr:hypothetical protein [Dehalococcoidales bacterium]
MSSVTKGIIIFITVLLIWGCGFALIYFYDDIFYAQKPVTTQTTSVSTTTASSASGLNSDELAYIQSVDYYNQIISGIVNTIDSLLANAQINDMAWAQQIADNAGALIAYNNIVAQIPTPNNAVMIQIQTVYLYAMGYYSTAVQTAVEGVNKADAVYFSIATAYMEAGTKARVQAITLLNEYISTYS